MFFMRFRGFFLVFLVLLWGWTSANAQAVNAKQPRILILLDGSSSMLQPWSEGNIRFRAASKIITTLIDSVYKVNKDVEFGLRVYGHQHPAQENDCYDTKLEVMFSKDNLAQMELRLEALHPAGVTPIAYSLKTAAENDLLDPEHYVYSLVLITDGGESCGGNICDVVQQLLSKKIEFKPYILSLVDYAPLKEEYKCLGNYLLVNSEKEIKPTVGTIVGAYRNMLTMRTISRQQIQEAVTKAPSVLKIDIPKFRVNTPVQEEKPEPVAVPESKPEKPKPYEKPPIIQPNIKTTTPTYDLTDRTVPQLPKEAIDRMPSLTKMQRMPVVFTTGIFKPITATKPKLPEPEKEVVTAPPPAIKPQPIVQKPIAAKPKPNSDTEKPKELKYDVQREDSKETTLELLFTDGKGHFYQTSPEILLTDPKTGKQVQRFFRTVDASGNPDPQHIPVGKYDLAITKSRVTAHGIEVKPNQKNKYLIYVSKGSLRFRYEDDPNEKQPVTEYAARVKKLFEPGPIVKQMCSQELEYDPGNYHISVNTLPRIERNVDLDFGVLVTIDIERPGYVQFTNTNAMGKVKLYYELGDEFVNFYEININGNLPEQKLELQRGKYRAVYPKHAGVAYSNETVKEFLVKSKQTVDVELD